MQAACIEDAAIIRPGGPATSKIMPVHSPIESLLGWPSHIISGH